MGQKLLIMLKKISGHNSRVTASAIAEMKNVTLAADDAGNKQQHQGGKHETTALPCNECEDDCGGYLVEPVPAPVPVPVQNPEQVQESEDCNCNGRMGPCPLDGDCMRETSRKWLTVAIF